LKLQRATLRSILKYVFVTVLVAAVCIAAVLYYVSSRGISARDQPGAIETTIARTMRSLAVPRSDRHRANPVKLSDEVFASAKAHWADHCASCHGNDGSGDTTIGKGLFPKAPDMRAQQTQSLSDGELFYIIENGIRLTGMPAWGSGSPDPASETWELVHFIRALPRLTPKDLEEISEMTPRSIRELREMAEMRKYLEGERPPKTQPHKHGGR
jgi:mono/diheme cytochrome c family protein